MMMITLTEHAHNKVKHWKKSLPSNSGNNEGSSAHDTAQQNLTATEISYALVRNTVKEHLDTRMKENWIPKMVVERTWMKLTG